MMMKKLLVFVILSTALIACKNKSVDQNTGQADELKAFSEKVDKISMDVRTPLDLMNMLELSMVDFMPELINDPKNSEKYLSNEVMAAANMGVYLVDGLYQYSSKEFTNGYYSMEAAKNLATKLGMGDNFDKMVLERYTELNPSVDSFLIKLNENIIASETVLKAKDRMRLFTGLIGGNYIEKQYILLNIIFKYNVDLPEESKLIALREVLYSARKQMDKLPDVIALIESVKKETDSGIILDKLKEIEAIRQQKVVPEDVSQITAAQIFQNPKLLEMFEKIKEVRSMIIAVPAPEQKK
jgi:hypothetical protein